MHKHGCAVFAAAVAPGETAHVKLVLVAQGGFTPDLQHCRDRFLVQSLPILPGQQPDSSAFKAQKFKVQDHKLRVSIVSCPPTSASERTQLHEGTGQRWVSFVPLFCTRRDSAAATLAWRLQEAAAATALLSVCSNLEVTLRWRWCSMETLRLQ